jgi:beta-glucosidase
MDWAPEAAAVLQCWLPGQEWGRALADVLFGAEEPGGRLPTTIPRYLDDAPSDKTYPGINGAVAYAEGLLMGYRGFDTLRIEPRFCFGHGLGYTTFSYSEARADGATVSVDVTNTGRRAGSEVVQCYVRAPERDDRPEQELRAFEKVRLDPGATTAVTFVLADRAFARWDGAWVVPAGAYEVRIGASSRDIRTRTTIEHPGGTLPL